MTRTLYLLLGAWCALLPLSAHAQAFFAEDGRVRFESSVPLHTFEGVSDQLTGRISLADSTVDFYVDLATLETGIGKRDKDMRKTLEVDDYPFAEFFGHLTPLPDSTRSGPQPVTASGTFGLHGRSQEIEVTGTLERTDQGWHLVAAWSITLDDYDIEPPRLLIMKVDPVQRIDIDILLQPEPGS